MTGKADFTDEEWNVVREGPPTAGMIVLVSSKGGSFRETWALAKTFAEARQQQSESELLDALVADKPDTPRFHSPEEAETVPDCQAKMDATIASFTGAVKGLGVAPEIGRASCRERV